MMRFVRSITPAIGLWTSFALAIVVCDATLLRACGLSAPAWGWNFCPATAPALSLEAERDTALRREVEQLEIDLARKQLACVGLTAPPPLLDLPVHVGPLDPQQTAELKPPPALPADRWDKKDLGILKGCWKLGRDAPIVLKRAGVQVALCTMKAGRLCFDGNGGGTAEQSSACPKASYHCKAPLTARFNDNGTLGTAQPQVLCQGTDLQTVWEARTDTCRRVDDTVAVCGDKEFRRESP